MAYNGSSPPLWVVVKVESGIPVAAAAYRSLPSAKNHERALRRTMNLENDETGIFEVYA